MFQKVSVGLEWSEEGWNVVVLSRRLGRLRLMDRIRVAGPPEEGRQTVGKFLDRLHAREARLNACLPRQSVLVRFLELPAEAEANLRHIMGFQIGSLHPFGEGEFYWDCEVVSRDREKKLVRVVVVIAEKSRFDQLRQEIVGLGLRVSSMTLGATGLVDVLRKAIPETAVVVSGCPEGVELLGFRRRELCATRIVPAEPEEDVAERLEQEMHAVRATLLMPDPANLTVFKWGSLPDPFAALLAEVTSLPKPQLDLAMPAELDLTGCWAALGTSYADLRRKTGTTINLLPSRVRWDPTGRAPALLYVMGSLVVVLAIAAGLHGRVEEALYARALDVQIHKWHERSNTVRKQMREQEELASNADLLEGVRRQTWQKLQVLEELTTLLPDGTWLQEVDVDQDTVVIFGTSNRAADLVQSLESSPHFSRVEFTSPITRDSKNQEIFRMRMRLEKPARP
jgi:Tfp pilus assembly protein PilN